jgi:hypothetical protein
VRDIVTESAAGFASIRIRHGLEGVDRGDEWALPRRTRYSTDEWIQRRMARNASSQDDLAFHVDAAVEAEHQEEFRIWNDEKAAVRKLEQLAEIEATREGKRRRWAERRREMDEEYERQRAATVDLFVIGQREVPSARSCMNWGCVIDRRTGKIEHVAGCAIELDLVDPDEWMYTLSASAAKRVAAWLRGEGWRDEDREE